MPLAHASRHPPRARKHNLRKTRGFAGGPVGVRQPAAQMRRDKRLALVSIAPGRSATRSSRPCGALSSHTPETTPDVGKRIAMFQTRNPYAGEPMLHHQLQQKLGVLSIRFLLPDTHSCNPGSISDPQLQSSSINNRSNHRLCSVASRPTLICGVCNFKLR